MASAIETRFPIFLDALKGKPINGKSIAAFTELFDAKLRKLDAMHQHYMCVMDAEFHKIPILTKMPFPQLTPALSKKNRYMNILPYAHSLVTLPDDGYVNGNYIPGPYGEKSYIACQAPLEIGFQDFYQMLWTNSCRTILMLTKWEDGKKAHRYFPEKADEEMVCGPYTVKCAVPEGSKVQDCLLHRELQIMFDGESRTVNHYQWEEWPDFGVPFEYHSVVPCLNVIHEDGAVGKPPVVVHCSAGVGRTGTLIAVDILMHKLAEAKMAEAEEVAVEEPKEGEEEEEEVDIVDSVLNVSAVVSGLREVRMQMVMNPDQYRYVYKCLQFFLHKESELFPGEGKAVSEAEKEGML